MFSCPMGEHPCFQKYLHLQGGALREARRAGLDKEGDYDAKSWRLCGCFDGTSCEALEKRNFLADDTQAWMSRHD